MLLYLLDAHMLPEDTARWVAETQFAVALAIVAILLVLRIASTNSGFLSSSSPRK